ncbi:Mannitol operon repressor [Vibrio mediterranei]|uniref:Transcriptional regulator n=2 Tax=Vibrio TaxID=662 RepID=A0A2S9ZJZ0_9VIBR|nr:MULTISPECIES: MltR family transcriptional regulator [Vibrio]AYV20142.1 transcriptional regulator [Vibrio mediterranei]EDL53446.1 predicted DNA-binding transcriptional regulator [Vibrio mediterranei AK1]KFA98716.1 transcriptional regulator [Vibrio sp. ER1A]MCF4172725.1 transcriptional regulator [Vibrio sp. McD22-P3]MCG9628842.1 transcriptional regulator [Vibrio mediterranei]
MSRIEDLLEKLDECDNATAFLQVSNKIINLKLKAILPSVFVQDELVKEYAVDPLLKEDGPLVTTDVVSKLVFAMGKISLETYSDIGLYDQVLEYALSRPEKVSFSDDMIYDFIENQAILSSQQDSFYIESLKQLKFSSFETFSQMRYESLIITVLKLSCEMLIQKIEEEIHQ